MHFETTDNEVRLHMTAEEYSPTLGDDRARTRTHKRAETLARNQGKKFVVQLMWGYDAPTAKERAAAPRARLFPRPVRQVGATTPELLAEELSRVASAAEVPRSILLRALEVEFVRAFHRRGPGDSWAKRIVDDHVADVRQQLAQGTPVALAHMRRYRARKR